MREVIDYIFLYCELPEMKQTKPGLEIQVWHHLSSIEFFPKQLFADPRPESVTTACWWQIRNFNSCLLVPDKGLEQLLADP